MDEKRTFYGLAIDPLHVGTGGYRLGRVDNTIVRDPGSNLPKIPGSSISGVCRNYAIYGLSPEEAEPALACARHKDEKMVRNNCGKCLICRTFGFASGKDKTNQMGLIRFFDAAILAFPVATMAGPVWVTTAGILANHGFDVPAQPGSDELITSFEVPGGKLNLGWLYLPCNRQDVPFPVLNVTDTPQVDIIKSRLVIAPEYLFSEIVNNNLEVRTSVSIDFDTGAAKKGALFTYEAIPRATMVAFDVVVDDYRCTEALPAKKVWKVVELGLERFQLLGLGGMNTRGFGRIKVLNP
jgi:CRISPR-associated protein Cmr4